MEEKELKKMAKAIVTRLETKIDEAKEEILEAIELLEVPAADDEEPEEEIEEDDYFLDDQDEAEIETYTGDRKVKSEIPKPAPKEKKPSVFDKILPGKKKGRPKKKEEAEEDVI